MNTNALTTPFWSPAEVDAAIPSTIAQLNARKVIAYPTETVYGLGGSVDQDSVDALMSLKQRPEGKPFLLLISDVAMLSRLDLKLSTTAATLAARFWPGPLTLVLAGGARRVPEALRGPDGGIGVRWTPHPGLQRLISSYGDAITSTSANLPGNSPAMSASTIARDWHSSIESGVLLVLDGGVLANSLPSTVINCMEARPRIIRPGAIAVDALRSTVPDLIGDND